MPQITQIYSVRERNREGRFENVNRTFSENFDPAWVTVEANAAMNVFANKAAKVMAMPNQLTNSQIRNVYGEIKRIQMNGFEQSKASFYLLSPKVAYTYGRNKNDGLELFKKIFDEAVKHVGDDRTYQNFCALMEAILAYHKFHGGK